MREQTAVEKLREELGKMKVVGCGWTSYEEGSLGEEHPEANDRILGVLEKSIDDIFNDFYTWWLKRTNSSSSTGDFLYWFKTELSKGRKSG